MIRPLVWNEFHREKNKNHAASEVYSNDIHQAITDFLQCDDYPLIPKKAASNEAAFLGCRRFIQCPQQQ